MSQDGFWKNKSLDQLSRREWESLCDGCARCCLLKLEDEDSGHIVHTDVACRLLDLETCRCSNYRQRQRLVPDCLRLDPNLVETLSWLPPTCAYRLVAEGKDLAWWHPLVSGRPETVHEAGVSVRHRVVAEQEVTEEELEDRAVDWPGMMPRRAPRRRGGR